MAKAKKIVESEAERDVTATFARRVEHVHVEELVASPLNPRKTRPADFEVKLRELAASIAQLGLIEAPMVREVREEGASMKYEVLAGERRWRASRIAAETVPARAWLDVVVIDVPDDVAFRIAIAENDQRDDMHPIDQCDAFVRLRDTEHASVAKIAALVGRTEQYVYDRLRLEQLTPTGRALLIEGRITLGVALIVARIGNAFSQDALISELCKRHDGEPIPVASAQSAAKRRLMVISEAPFDVRDAQLTKAPSCMSCPKRSETQQKLFGDLLDDPRDRCTDPECWEEKVEAHWTTTSKRAEAEGKVVATEAAAKKIFPTPYGPAHTYVDLDAHASVNNETGETKTWREVIAGRDDVTITVVRTPDGRAREVAKRDDVRVIGPISAEDAERDAADLKAHAERQIQWAVDRALEVNLRNAISTRIQGGDWKRPEFWRAFTHMVLNWWDNGNLVPSDLTRYGFSDEEITAPPDTSEPYEAVLLRKIETWSDAQRLALCTDLLVGGLGLLRDAEPVGESLLASLGIDRKLHEKEVRKSVKASLKAEAAE